MNKSLSDKSLSESRRELENVLFGIKPVENPVMDQLKEAVLRADKVAGHIKTQEKVLDVFNEEHRQLTTQIIPDLMAELGELSEVKSSWGTVRLNPFWSGKITPETEAKAFEWLEGNGHGGIVKRDITVSIMKGDDRHAEEVRRKLDELCATYEERQGVHYQTLQGFIRNMARDGTPVPVDLFNVYSGTVAKVSVNKEQS